MISYVKYAWKYVRDLKGRVENRRNRERTPYAMNLFSDQKNNTLSSPSNLGF